MNVKQKKRLLKIDLRMYGKNQIVMGYSLSVSKGIASFFKLRVATSLQKCCHEEIKFN